MDDLAKTRVRGLAYRHMLIGHHSGDQKIKKFFLRVMLMKHHLTSVTFKGFDESYFFVFNKQNTICAQIYIIITGTC